MIIVTLAFSSRAFAQFEPLSIENSEFNLPLQAEMECLRGRSANINPRRVLAKPLKAFEPLDFLRPYYSQTPLWCRILLENKTGAKLQAALVIPLPQRYFQMYEVNESRSALIPSKILSDIDNPSIVFSVDFQSGQKEIFFHFIPVSPYRLFIHPHIMDMDSYRRGSSFQLIALMLSLGILCALGIYYLMTGLALLAPSNIYYACCNFLLAALMLCQAGYINLNYSPDLGFTNYIHSLSRMIVVGFLITFSLYTIHFLDVYKRFRKLSKIIKAGGKIWLLVVIINELLISVTPGIKMSYLIGFSLFNFFLPLVGIGGYVIAKGLIFRHKMTYILLLSFAPLVVVYINWILIPSAFGNVDWATALAALSIGISLSSIFLGIALAYNLHLQRLQTENMRSMMIASKTVQSALLPTVTDGISAKSLPFDITSYYSAAHLAGGDWFSYHYSPEHETLVLQICDVTGHGIPAAIITGVITGAAYSCLDEIEREHLSSADAKLTFIANKINKVLRKTGARVNCFATMSLVFINTRTGQGFVCGAGHPPVYLFSENKVKTLVARGSVLGFQDAPEFQVQAFSMQPGESLLCYTDGLLENTNNKGEQIKTRELKKVLKQKMSAEDMKRQIVNLVAKHLNGKAYDDDVSFVITKYKGSQHRLESA